MKRYGAIFRFWRIFWGIVPPIGMMIRDYHHSLVAGDGFDWHHPKRRRRAKRLVERFADLGPTFIKLAQVLAARADLFPGIYLEELRHLHDHVTPLPAMKILRQFHDATARSDGGVRRVRYGIIASASLGQVHALVQGHPVAVKDSQPKYRETVDKDVRVLGGFSALRRVLPKTRSTAHYRVRAVQLDDLRGDGSRSRGAEHPRFSAAVR